MKEELPTILRSFSKVRLTAQEKGTMKKNLESQIGLPSPANKWHTIFWSHQMKVAYGVLFITLSFGSSVVAASGQSLPGDLLYAVKTQVSEKLERVFAASTPDDRAQFETRLVARRFEEAEKLAEGSALEDGKKEMAKTQIERQIEKAELALSKIKHEEPAIESTSMMMQSFSATTEPAPDTSARKIANDDRDDYSRDRKNSDDENDNNREKRKDHEERKKFDLDEVLEKHKDIAKKLDIKKSGRSGWDD